MSSVHLKVQRVTKHYNTARGPLHVLTPISFSAARGEFVALVGPSGCGKSTLLNIVCGLEPTDSGHVFIDGNDTTGQAGHVAYMPQDDLLFPWRTLTDNIALPMRVRGMPRRQARQQALDLLPLVGLDGFGRAYPAQLSGGMRQRAALLRTWIHEPRLVALDEPFGSLDALTRSEMHRWLLRIRGQYDSTLLLVTHDIDEALVLADRIIVMSPRPARVAAQVDVPLPRPRDVWDERLQRIKRELWHTMTELQAAE